MAFLPDKLSKLTGQTLTTLNWFSYFPDNGDDLAAVTTTGYFARSQFIESEYGWANASIVAILDDGYCFLQVDDTEITAVVVNNASGDSAAAEAAAKAYADVLPGRLLGTVIGSGGSYTPSIGCTHALIRLQAGGGGGGGADTAAVSGAAGGGGSAGGYLEVYVPVSHAVPLTISIGAAGSAGAAAAGTGGDGGDTTIVVGATTYTAKGGKGGIGSVGGTTINSVLGGDSPTISTNGDVNSGGSPGSPGLTMTGLLASSGAGGSSVFGAGGNGKNTQSAGSVGVGHGSGGSGGCCVNGGAAAAGGAGLIGLIVIQEYT